MKLKSKLIMSGVALAACAATLTSTTYAWYTTNTEVSATGISGAALDSGASSIYISLNNSDWAQTVDLGEILANNNGLTPVALDGEGNFRLLDNAAAAAGFMGANAGAGDLVSFTLYFKTAKTSANVDIFFKDLILKNSAADLNSYKVDNLLYDMDYTKLPLTAAYNDSTEYFTYTPTSYSVVSGITNEETYASKKEDTEDKKLYEISGSTYAESTGYKPGTTYYSKTASSYNKVTGEAKTALATPAKFTAALEKGLYVVAAKASESGWAGVDRTQATYAVDFIKALGMTTSANDASTTYGAYDLATEADENDITDVNVSLPNAQNGALNYYNEVMGTNVVKPGTVSAADTDSAQKKVKLSALSNLAFSTASSNGSKICTVPADGTSVAVTFKIFLNGWDEYCYDCCKGQSFNMQMAFTSKKVA